jgi:hypothetical protein
MSIDSARPAPIFILGVQPRSGTNFLWDLLGLHPDTELMRPVYEDHLVRWTPHLFHYVEDVARRWSPEWEVGDDEATELLLSLGDGLEAWVAGASCRRVVTKMPSVENAQHFFDVFRSSPLVVIVRDGRSLAESGVRTFGWTYEWAFRRWARATQVVLDLQLTAPPDRFCLVRYEDLVEHPRETVRLVCERCGLDPESFPYERIDELPVRGSSALAAAGGGVHWQPTEKPEGFAPIERWESWPPHLHRRFARVAGVQQRALGYGLLNPSGSDTTRERLTDLRDHAHATYLKGHERLGRLRRAVLRTSKGS